MNISFLLVTCCLEKTRTDALRLVIENLKIEAPELLTTATVFDNASTEPETTKLLSAFSNVYVADRNVGYWTAVDWWLTHELHSPPAFTYIIESDMIHYDFKKIWQAAKFLESNSDIGAVRLHEYSVENSHLYNKDKPHRQSRINVWQSHINKVTGQPVTINVAEGVAGIYPANFLTQLPALNRYKTIRRAFDELSKLKTFSELDFQRLYHQEYSVNAVLDGGIYHHDPGSFSSGAVTGSWTSPEQLAQMGYQNTRHGTILDPAKYTVSKVS